MPPRSRVFIVARCPDRRGYLSAVGHHRHIMTESRVQERLCVAGSLREGLWPAAGELLEMSYGDGPLVKTVLPRGSFNASLV